MSAGAAMRERLREAGPGRAEDAERLVALHGEIASGRRPGATVFVGGEDSDGRTELLKTLAAELRRSRSGLVAGRFEGDSFEPWHGADAPLRKAALELLESVIPIAQALHPAIAMLSTVMSPGKAAWRLVSQIKDRGREIDPALLLPQLLRISAQERPMACIVDFARDAQVGWWEDLLTLFAKEVGDDLPMLLVLGIEGPAELPDEQSQASCGVYAAQTLTRRQLAQWWPLRDVDRDCLAGWLGSAQPPVIDALLAASQGRSALAAQLWHAWEAAAIVERSRGGSWELTPGGQANVVVDRLKRLAVRGDGLRGIERARALLSVAALEGRRFTAEAVARALELERDEAIDYIDDVLVVSASNPDGFVAEVGGIEIEDPDGHRHLWMYRFVSALDHMTLRHSVASQEEAQQSAQLAEALVECYGGASPFIAATIARLFDAGGKSDVAGNFWKMTRVGQDDEVTMWRAMRLLEAPQPGDELEGQRGAEILLAAARALYHSARMTDGLALAQAAIRWAGEGTEEQGAAYYFSAWFRNQLQQQGDARNDLLSALAIARRLHLSAKIADATHQLANLDVSEEDYDSARRRYREVLEIRVRLQDVAGVATVREMFAELDRRAGDIISARAQLAEILAIERHIGDLNRQALTLSRMAGLEIDQGDYERARELYRESLMVGRAADSEHVATMVGYNLAHLHGLMGDQYAAREGFLEVLRLSMGNPVVQAGAHQRLGEVEIALGDQGRARTHFTQALNLHRGLGDAVGESEAQQALDELDMP
ncbi:MAG: hypothetical protein QOI73_1050 [Solirubrobacteraceae bacterium]|nr:hypothetical protein [Solirubrobacteraceae bacterium]